MKYLVDEKKIAHTLLDFICFKNEIWFVDSGCNELYSYNIKTQTSMLQAKFHSEPEYGIGLFRQLIAVEDKLFVIPFSAKSLYEVDVSSGKIEKIEIDLQCGEKYEKYLDIAKFSSAHKYGNSIYLIGHTYPGIVEYDYVTKNLTYYFEWVEQTSLFWNSKEAAFFRKSILVNNKIYAPSCKGNQVLEFDLESKTYIWHEVGSRKCSYSAICQQGDWFWLAPRDKGPVVKWNRNTMDIVEFDEYPQECVLCEGSFGDCISFNGHVFLFPVLANCILRIEIATGKIEQVKINNFDCTKACAYVYENRLYIYSFKANEFIALDMNDKVTYLTCRLPEKQYNYHKKQHSYTYRVLVHKVEYDDEKILMEDDVDILKKYIDYVVVRE